MNSRQLVIEPPTRNTNLTSILFSLTSALLFLGVINMHSTVGRKICDTETKPLSSSDKLNRYAHGLYGFLKEYLYCGDENGCPDTV